MDFVFHSGELAVQAIAGVSEQAERVGRGIRSTIPPPARDFLAAQPMIVVAGLAGSAVWASPLTGPPGFVRVVDERLVQIGTLPSRTDPLAGALQPGDPLGLLAIDLATRRRMRLNGTVRSRGVGDFAVEAAQVYANCPKYIQARELVSPGQGHTTTPRVDYFPVLTSAHARWIETADTFFIATVHPEGGADASHRGGQPGFVRVLGADRLVFPDYAGNTMFQTLGNLAVDPRAGLLFVDFASGRTLHLTGRAEVDWNAERTSEFLGAERVVDYRVDEAVETVGNLPLRWRFVGYSPFNPREPAEEERGDGR